MGNRKVVTATLTLTNIKYSITGPKPLSWCLAVGDGKDGEFIGGITVEAFKHEKTTPVECTTPLSNTGKTTPGNYYGNCEGDAPNLELTQT